MDNMSLHRSREASKAYERLNILPIFNVPYSPPLNGIEGVFGMIKAAYKKMLLKNLLAGRDQVQDCGPHKRSSSWTGQGWGDTLFIVHHG
jgi:transposase